MKKNLALATLLSLLSISCQPGYGRQSGSEQNPTTIAKVMSTMVRTKKMTDEADAEIVAQNKANATNKSLWGRTKDWGSWIVGGVDYSTKPLRELELLYRRSPSNKLADVIAARKNEIDYLLGETKTDLGQDLVAGIIDKRGNKLEKLGEKWTDNTLDRLEREHGERIDDSTTPTDQVAELITDTKRLSNISKREIKNALLAELGDDFNITQLPTKQQLKNVEQAALGQIQEWYTERQTVASLTKRIKDLINQNITAILTRAPAKGKSYDEHALDQIDKLNTALNLQN